MENRFARVHPELVSEWSESNFPLTPEDITYGSKKVVWWRADCGHEWQASPKSRSAGEKCPICAGKRVIPGINDLATINPELAEEWSGEHIFPDKTPEVKLGLTTSYELTKPELDVLRALMQSTSDEDAAAMVGCSKANIRWHISRILDKTGYRTRMELLIAVASKNLIIVTPDKTLEDDNF